jgi:4a-hydroxytetrahydrobiopterin dehydratase
VGDGASLVQPDSGVDEPSRDAKNAVLVTLKRAGYIGCRRRERAVVGTRLPAACEQISRRFSPPMASEKLTQEGIDAKLAELPEWSSSGGALQRTFKFENFVEAMAFVNKVAEQAEDAQHHPDILVRYSKVTLTLSTHDAGGITQKDFDFAREVDRLLSAAR